MFDDRALQANRPKAQRARPVHLVAISWAYTMRPYQSGLIHRKIRVEWNIDTGLIPERKATTGAETTRERTTRTGLSTVFVSLSGAKESTAMSRNVKATDTASARTRGRTA